MTDALITFALLQVEGVEMADDYDKTVFINGKDAIIYYAGHRPSPQETVNHGIKHDQGKVPMELLSPIALTKISEVLAFGAKKYQDHNWRKGLKWSRVAGAAIRHLLAWLGGEDKDVESGLPHLAHCACCIMFLLEFSVTKPELDDRWKA